MKYTLELLKADLADELAKLERLAQEFSRIDSMLEQSSAEVSSYDRAAIGYYLHSFYNGCESIFRSIARFFENDLGRDSWHSDLLKRMKLAVPGFRPAVIDDELFTLLDDFRAFRHKFRHAYTFELDWDKERLVAKKFRRTLTLLQTQITHFLAQFDQIES